MFPDYLSGFYDYPIMKHMKIFKIEATLFEYIKKSCDTWLLKFRNHWPNLFIVSWCAISLRMLIPRYHNLRGGHLLYLSSANSARCGFNSLVRWSFLWNNLPSRVKKSRTLEEFENRFENLRYIYCSCTVCRWRIFKCTFALIRTFISFYYVFLWV